MKIIFMGTPEFACPTLEKLIAEKEFEIVAVYTREPQIAGRGHKLTNSQVHELALKNGLKIVTPKTLRNAEAQKEFSNFKADAAVVVAYGLILPQEILDAPKLGCINIHPSLLPKWRGAAPINHTIMAGDHETGVDIIKMDIGVDSGNIIAEEKFMLNGDENYSDLAEKLSKLGAELLVKTLKKLKNGEVVETKQNNALASYAKKIEKPDCQVNWQNSAKEIEQKIRALDGFLGAYFLYNEEKIKIFKARILDKNTVKAAPGKILDEKFSIQCDQGIIQPVELQRQGKNRVTIDEFLRGFKVEVGKII